MSNPAIALADEVLSVLEEASLSLEFDVSRMHVPKFNVESSTDVQLCVVAKSDERGDGTGGTDDAEIVIDIGVFKRLQNAVSGEQDEVDAILDFCSDELRPLFNRQRPSGASDFICTGISQNPLYDVQELDENRVFLSVLSLTYLGPVDV